MLKLIGATKIYKSSGFGIKGIDIVLPDKGMVIVKGESGSGKSTLMNILTGSDYLDSGKYLFNDTEITAKNADDFRRNHISTIYQDFRIIEDLSVSDNVALAMQACNNKVDREYIQSIIGKVGLERYVDTLPKNLSGGELQRCAIARAIAKQDTAIFADEPTGNLDSANGKQIMDLLKEISQERLVVVITHNESYAKQYADMTVTLRDGEVASVEGEQIQEEQSTKEQAINKAKPKLSAKTMFKLTKWSFGKKKVKLGIIIALAVLTIILNVFSLFLAMPNYNASLINSACQNANRQYFSIQGGVNNVEFDDLNNELGNVVKFGKVFQANNNSPLEWDVASKYARVMISNKFIAIDDMSELDTTIIEGRFPQNENEIMVAKSYAQAFSAKGYMQIDGQIGNNVEKIDNLSDVIGKKVQWSDTQYVDFNVAAYSLLEYTICGLFEDYYVEPDAGASEQEKSYASHNSLREYFVIKSTDTNPLSKVGINYSCLVGDREFYSVTIFDARYNVNIQEPKQSEIYFSNSYSDSFSVGETIRIISSDNEDLGEFTVGGFYDNFNVGIVANKETVARLLGEDVQNLDKCSITFNGNKYKINLAKINTINSFITTNYRNNFDMFANSKNVYFYTTNSQKLQVNISDIRDMKTTYIAIACVTIACYVLLLAIVIDTFVDVKKKQISIMRAIGFDFVSILGLMLLQFFIVAIAEFAVGISLGALLMPIVNKILLAGSPYMKYSILSLTWESAAIIGGIMIVANLIIGLIKTYKLFSKSANESYKG